MEKIKDVRLGRITRYGRVHRQFLVHRNVYRYSSRRDEAHLNIGDLIQELDRDRVKKSRFEVMQSYEEFALNLRELDHRSKILCKEVAQEIGMQSKLCVWRLYYFVGFDRGRNGQEREKFSILQ